MTTAQFSREDIMRVSMRESMREDVREEVREELYDEVRDKVRDEVRAEVQEQMKYDMALNFYKQGIDESVIAQAAGITVEELKRWIDLATEE